MKPKCLVFEVRFLRTFDSKKQDSLIHSKMNILTNGRHHSTGESKEIQKRLENDKLKFKANTKQLLPTETAFRQRTTAKSINISSFSTYFGSVFYEYLIDCFRRKRIKCYMRSHSQSKQLTYTTLLSLLSVLQLSVLFPYSRYNSILTILSAYKEHLLALNFAIYYYSQGQLLFYFLIS